MLSRLSRLLLIREDEQKQVTYFFILYAILGCGIAFGRNSTDVLFFKRYGIEFLPVMYMVFSVCLALVSTVYAAFADRISPERLSMILFIFLIGLLLGNWAWISFSNIDAAYPAYFLLYEIASEILIVHSAHYLAQNFNSLQAKRLFPLVMAGTQIGIIIGSLTLAAIAHYINIQDILLVWCLLLSITITMIYSWHKQQGSSTYFRPLHKSTNRFKQAVSQVTYGATLINTSPLLKAASFALFFMVITFYILCYSVNRIYTKTFETEAELTSFFGILLAATNGFALLLQIFVTNRVIRRFGVKNVNMFFPITSLFSYFALFTSFSLIPAILGSINKDAIMPAFRNPIRTIFFNTLPENVRGRARATSVVIVLPLALFLCGLLLIIMQKLDNPAYFLAFGVIAAMLYLFFNHKMNKAYVNEMLSTLKKKVILPERTNIEHADSGQSNDLLFLGETSEIPKSKTIARLFRILTASYPEKVNELHFINTSQNEIKIIDQLVRLLTPLNPKGFSEYLEEIYPEQQDEHLIATFTIALFKLGSKKINYRITEMLYHRNPRVKVAAIYGALLQSDVESRDKALKEWQSILVSSEIGTQLAVLELLDYLYLLPGSNENLLPLYKELIISMLKSANQRAISSALNILMIWPESQFAEITDALNDLYDEGDTATRLLCTRCCRLTYNTDQVLLQKAIEDSNRYIRQEAARVHYEMAGDDAKDIFVIWLSTEANGSPRAQNAFLGLLHEISTNSVEFRQIAQAKAEVAQQFFLAAQILDAHPDEQSAAYQLVRHILQERIKQYIDLSVHAMQGFEKAEDIYIIRAGLKSRDSRHIANACEALRNFKNNKLGEMLYGLVDRQPQTIRKHGNLNFSDTVESVLSWCKNLPDPWLHICAKEALKTLV